MGVASKWGVEASIHMQKTCSGCYRTVGQQVTGKVLTTSFQGTLPACAFAGSGQRAAGSGFSPNQGNRENQVQHVKKVLSLEFI